MVIVMFKYVEKVERVNFFFINFDFCEYWWNCSIVYIVSVLIEISVCIM